MKPTAVHPEKDVSVHAIFSEQHFEQEDDHLVLTLRTDFQPPWKLRKYNKQRMDRCLVLSEQQLLFRKWEDNNSSGKKLPDATVIPPKPRKIWPMNQSETPNRSMDCFNIIGAIILIPLFLVLNKAFHAFKCDSGGRNLKLFRSRTTTFC